MMIWFTADTHFGHENIINICNRPFQDAWQMDCELIRRWNILVDKNDTVYHLGDFVWKNSRVEEILGQLNGNIRFLQGNHDHKKFHKKVTHEGDYKTLKIEDQFIVLCHYPILSWDRMFHGSWHLFGHVHGSKNPGGKSLDVGVDNWAYAPISFNEIKQKLKEN